MLSLLFIFFPLTSYFCLYLFLWNQLHWEEVRKVALRAALIWAAILVTCLEGLSLFHAITRLGLVAVWSVLLVAWGIWVYARLRSGKKLSWPRFSFPRDWASRIILGVILVISVTTFIIAWVTPPQTYDSLTYHMSRVAHWAQDRSLAHYRTGIPRQVSMSPGAEMITLNGYVLTGSDRLATFTEWGAMLGSLVGVSLIASLLGAKPFGQWVAAGFAATIPMGLVQASSTITDYVAAFWLVCVAAECLDYLRTKENSSLVFLSLAAGLAILTKPNTVTYLAVFAVFTAVLVIWRMGIRRGLQWAVTAVLIVGIVNAGYLARNISLYSSLSNPVDFATQNNRLKTLKGFISNTLKNAGQHAGLPYLLGYDAKMTQLIKDVHIKMGLELLDPRTTGDGTFSVSPPTTQEDVTTNPYHAYIILATTILVFVLFKKTGRAALLYTAGVTLAFILFSGLFKWHIFNVRYHMAFFVLFSPVVGVLVSSLNGRTIGSLLVAGLFVLTIPWLVSISSRPLIPIDGYTTQSSILTTPREELYFSNDMTDYEPFKRIVGDVNAQSCSQIGLMLNGDDPEYLLWALMGAPKSDLKIEWIVADPYNDRLPEPNFQPCAIICRDCSDQVIRGLDFAYETTGYKVYLPSGN